MKRDEEIERLREQLRVKQQRIADLEALVRLMRSRVETAPAPFGKGLEIRVLVSGHDLVTAYDPHAIIDYVFDGARHKVHEEARRVGSTLLGKV